MTVSRYQVIDGQHNFELEIKKSKFIGHVGHSSDRQQAMDFIASIKTLHPQASHNCWAFQAGPPGSSQVIGCSDDGEPHGTAGKPILNVLMHAKVGEIAVVVTRYYGGIKLGTGGLARAYSESAKKTIEHSETIEKFDYVNIELEIEYQQWSQLELLLHQFQAHEVVPVFNETVKISSKIDEAFLEDFNKKFRDLTLGKGVLIKING